MSVIFLLLSSTPDNSLQNSTVNSKLKSNKEMQVKNRNPIAVALLPFITFGIYEIYWLVKTKGEMNQRGAIIPSAWLLIVPFVNIWWLWKYSEGVEHVTQTKMSTVIAFILIWLLHSIGAAIIQDGFNKIAPLDNVPAAIESPTPDPSLASAAGSPVSNAEPESNEPPSNPVI